jgi:flavin reductase (DIM6/NTAB) family NADH-FMN oxidoreductase RutF
MLNPDQIAAMEVTLYALRPFPVAVTTHLEGRDNGLISLSAGCGGIIPEAMRVLVSLTKHNLTHDMVLASGVLSIHLLSSEPALLPTSLEIMRELGGKSGRDGDKMAQFRTKPGVTGAPILLDALSYVEGRVVGTLDATENTTFLADVVAAEVLNPGEKLGVAQAWANQPPEWLHDLEVRSAAQIDEARTVRGLPTRGEAGFSPGDYQ